MRMDDIVFEGKLWMALAVCVCNYENASMLSKVFTVGGILAAVK
jgi:hypothetical protein